MRGCFCFALILTAMLAAFAAEARVFNYKDSSLAAFIRGTGGFAPLNQDAFIHGSGTGTSITGSSKYNYGGELGFLLGLGANFHVRLGAEVIQYSPVIADGVDSGGTSRYTLNSSVFVFNPNLTFEFVYGGQGVLRYFASLGVGYANVTVVNNYKMTPTGTSALGVGDYNETMETNVLSGHAGVGLEVLFTDNVTFITDVGYRYLPVGQMKYKSDVQNILSPTAGVQKGDIVLNEDGSKRKMNLGGLFGGVAFRFYLNFL